MILTLDTVYFTLSSARFDVYLPDNSCLIVSNVSHSLGTINATTWSQYLGGFYYTFKGFRWNLDAIIASPMNTVATFVFTVRSPYDTHGGCIEGSVSAKMQAPASIYSAGNFWDGDFMPVVINPSL